MREEMKTWEQKASMAKTAGWKYLYAAMKSFELGQVADDMAAKEKAALRQGIEGKP